MQTNRTGSCDTRRDGAEHQNLLDVFRMLDGLNRFVEHSCEGDEVLGVAVLQLMRKLA